MARKFFLIILCIFSLYFQSCTNTNAAFSPFDYAPQNPCSTWSPCKKNILISSKYCEMLLPKNFGEQETTLGELIDIALNNSPDTKITWSEARAKAAAYGQSLSPYFPELTGSAVFMRERETFSLNEDLTQQFRLTTINADLNLTYTLLDFGQRKYSSEMARQTLMYADWSHNQEIQTLIQTVMNDFYDYLFQVQQLSAYEADLESAKLTLDSAKQQFHFGVAAIGDITQAKTKYLQEKIDVLLQKKKVENSFAKLLKDVGLPANMEFKIQQLPEKVFVDIILENVEDLISKAQHQRQDLFAAEADVFSKEAEVSYSKSLYWPTVSGDFDFGKRWFNHNVQEDYHWTLTVSLEVPLFKGFWYRNKVKAAKSDLSRSTAVLLQKELEVIQEVTTSHFDVQTAAQTLACAEDYLEQAKEEFDIALSNYKAGVNTILDVISAQAFLADARSKLADSKKEWYVSLANLAYSTGSLCAPPENASRGVL